MQLVDVMPTVLELVGLPVPEDLDGRSLAPLVLGEREQLEPRPAFAELRTLDPVCRDEHLSIDCWKGAHSVQTDRFKLVRSVDGSTEELYDLESDPGETRNVAADHPEVVAEHRALLEAHLARGARLALRPESQDGTAELGDELRERLEALGYAQ